MLLPGVPSSKPSQICLPLQVHLLLNIQGIKVSLEKIGVCLVKQICNYHYIQ